MRRGCEAQRILLEPREAHEGRVARVAVLARGDRLRQRRSDAQRQQRLRRLLLVHAEILCDPSLERARQQIQREQDSAVEGIRAQFADLAITDQFGFPLAK